MATFTACEKNEYAQLDDNIITQNNIKQQDGAIVLGEKINDPFAITNIQKAASSLRSSGVETPADIVPNKVYLRFLPKTEAEWDILKSDSTLILYDFPLNYEIEEGGVFHHDPSLPDSTITWQYTVVPIDYPIPNIQHEILYEVYIPNFNDDEISGLRGGKDNFDELLIMESFKLTGNEEQLKNSEEFSTRGLFNPKRWSPSGRITVWDDVLNQYIPLEGAEVHARWSTHIERSISDINGKFKMGGFIYRVNYAIKWQRGDYDIRDGNFGQAWYNGPKQKGDWNLNIGTGGKSIMYATITRAANKHFYGDNLGIRRPTIFNSKTKICYIDGKGSGVFWGDWSAGGILPDIKIWGKDSNNGSYKTTNIVFGTTAHELGHQSHSLYMGNIQFYQVAKVIYESWADAVEWAFTNDEYHKLGNKYSNSTALTYNHYRGNQSWLRSDPNWEYSPLFIDLMDDFNQRTYYGSNYPNDNIKGYPLSNIFNHILKDSYGINSFEKAIKKYKLTGVTDVDIENLLEFYR